MAVPLSRNRVGGEAEQEEEGSREAQPPSAGGQRNFLEKRRRASRPQKEEHEGPQDPSRPEEPEGKEEVRYGARELLVSAPEERIGDVTAVELAGRKKVQGGDEQPDPPREGHGVQYHVVPVRDGPVDGVRRSPEEDRLPEGDPRRDPGGPLHGRQLEPDEEDGHGHERSRDRPGGPDVHQGVPVRDGRPDLDEGAERPDERRGGGGGGGGDRGGG